MSQINLYQDPLEYSESGSNSGKQPSANSINNKIVVRRRVEVRIDWLIDFSNKARKLVGLSDWEKYS